MHDRQAGPKCGVRRLGGMIERAMNTSRRRVCHGRVSPLLIEFQQRFADEAACAAYLREARWPGGFVCPACGGVRGWELATKAWTHECAECGKQTSVTAGTVLHGSKLPLTVWFWAAYLMAPERHLRSVRNFV